MQKQRVLIIGAPFRNATHGCEVGVIDAFRELEWDITALDFQFGKCDNDETCVETKDINKLVDFSFQKTPDFVLCVGPGLPNNAAENQLIKQYFTKHLVCLWNSEPIRLKNYYDKTMNQRELFNVYFTFDEGEVPLYHSLGIKSAFFLPQAYNPKWYSPANINKEKFACFVGSIGGKWNNREYFLNRILKILPKNQLSIETVFNAEKINKIYNKHHIVLNLGLYHNDLGAPTYLSSYGIQQRVFESIGAGAVPFTNLPADMKYTQQQQLMFENHTNIIYYTNEDLEALLKYYFENPQKINKIRNNVLNIRDKHTYKSRIQTLLQILSIN